jgi:ComEC/Rec2-related protein
VVWGPAAALVAGILHSAALLAAALLWLFGLVCIRRVPRLHSILLLVLMLLFYARGYRTITHVHRHIAHFEGIASTSDEALPLRGWVASYPEPAYGGVRFEFLTSNSATEHRVWLRTREFAIDYGDSLQLLAKLDSASRRKHFSRGFLLGRGLCGTARALPGAVENLGGREGSPFKRAVLWPIHKRGRCAIHRGVGSRAGVPMALLLGERGRLERKVRESFVTLGISHLLALSGFHLGFIAGMMVLLLRAAKVRRRWPVLGALWAYVALVGFIVSLYRALIMVAILSLATAVHRPLRPMTALAGALVLMLLLYPYALFSIGFQLSFIATFAVLLSIRRLPPAPSSGAVRKVLYWARSTVEVSAVVQIFIAPILLAYFGRISLAAPLTTAVFAGPVMILLALSGLAVVFGHVSPVAGPWLFDLLRHATVIFEALLGLFVKITPAPIEIAAPNAYLYYCGFSMLWMSGKRPWLALTGLSAMIAAWLPALR